MEISNATGPGLGGLQSLLSRGVSSPANRAVDRDGDNDGSGGQVGGTGGGRGGKLLQAVVQTLNQLGLTAKGQIAVASVGGAQDTATHTDTNSSASQNGQNVAQALHAFMHSLFQALGSGPQQTSGIESASNSDANKATGAISSESTPYGSLSVRLQSLANGNPSSSNSTDLASSYQNLVQALGGTVGSGTDTQSSLQTFLQDLAKNVQNAGGSLSGTGSVISQFA